MAVVGRRRARVAALTDVVHRLRHASPACSNRIPKPGDPAPSTEWQVCIATPAEFDVERYHSEAPDHAGSRINPFFNSFPDNAVLVHAILGIRAKRNLSCGRTDSQDRMDQETDPIMTARSEDLMNICGLVPANIAAV